MFSGAPRKSDVRSYLQKLCVSAGVQLQMTEIDLQISEDHDMSDEDRWQELITKIRNGEFDILIMSPPCSTWSRAVWANRLGPKPVRSREFPFGFPWLKGDLKEKAELGTLLVMRCIETLETAPATTVCLWEHPEDLGRVTQWNTGKCLAAGSPKGGCKETGHGIHCIPPMYLWGGLS